MMESEQTQKLVETRFWKNMSQHDRAKFQLFTDEPCMPFDVFHEAIEVVLNRTVLLHEIVIHLDRLKEEFLNGAEPPSFEEIINLIPESERAVVFS